MKKYLIQTCLPAVSKTYLMPSQLMVISPVTMPGRLLNCAPKGDFELLMMNNSVDWKWGARKWAAGEVFTYAQIVTKLYAILVCI